ncbi:hypothetical protein [Bosea sp. ANAM02]|uniref:hypothetical protein n=1 Tax=Bosea sp. ANAM02 TaxID=2020412 RepID=UPI00140EAA0A|nr:hypothetical protein [Bosea sp. ANAM02]BCB22458.1 hypothetical protein OCUBac02_53520 [Bosea sp. ANAM02]
MNLQGRANSYIIIARAPNFVAPFDDGCWHLVAEGNKYADMRTAFVEIVPGVDEINGELIMAAIISGKSGLELKGVVLKVRNGLVVPKASEIVEDAQDQLRCFNLVVEAGKNSKDPQRWRDFLASIDFDDLPEVVIHAIHRQSPVVVSFKRPPRSKLTEFMESRRGLMATVAASLAALAFVIAGVSAITSSNAEDRRRTLELQAYAAFRDGAMDIVRSDENKVWFTRTRMYPDGTSRVIDQYSPYSKARR